MTSQKHSPFKLQPWKLSSQIESIEIQGTLAQSDVQAWHLSFEVTDRDHVILWNKVGGMSDPTGLGQMSEENRLDELWRSTCFEIFLGVDAPDSRYLEYNFSPTGSWQLYAFTDYRQNSSKPAVMAPRYQIQLHPAESKLMAHFWFMAPAAFRPTRASVTAVIETRAQSIGSQSTRVQSTSIQPTGDSEISYWAVRHCGKKPDFHLRDSFVLKF